jgi:hypothetical protein
MVSTRCCNQKIQHTCSFTFCYSLAVTFCCYWKMWYKIDDCVCIPRCSYTSGAEVQRSAGPVQPVSFRTANFSSELYRTKTTLLTFWKVFSLWVPQTLVSHITYLAFTHAAILNFPSSLTRMVYRLLKIKTERGIYLFSLTSYDFIFNFPQNFLSVRMY